MNRMLIFLYAVLLANPSFADEKETKVLIKTTMGKITVKLYNETPLHRDNFLKLVEEHQYDSIMFHRVIKLFMIQAGEKYPPIETEKIGDSNQSTQVELEEESPGKWKKFFSKFWFKSKKKKKEKIKEPVWRDPNYVAPNHKIPAEIIFPQYFHKRGQLCAAREEDKVNPERLSSGIQFYIVTGKYFTDHELDKMEREKNITFTPEQRQAFKFEGGAPHLDGEYTIFGEVTKGLRTVQKIELSSTDYRDRPLKDIRIKTMKILKK